MTRDKVTLRLNLIVKYRVTDPVKAVQTVASLRDALYLEAQMSVRHYVAELTLDQLLERRAQAVAPMAEALRERAASWGAEVLNLGVSLGQQRGRAGVAGRVPRGSRPRVVWAHHRGRLTTGGAARRHQPAGLVPRGPDPASNRWSDESASTCAALLG